MYLKNSSLLSLLLVLAFLFSPSLALGRKPLPSPGKQDKIVLTGPNKKNQLGDYYFTYKFNQRPTLGTNILKVQIFDRHDKQTAVFMVTGSTGMPSMGSAHNSGEQGFKISKKNDYLLPVDLVMRGDWEISLIFYKGKAKYGEAKINLNI